MVQEVTGVDVCKDPSSSLGTKVEVLLAGSAGSAHHRAENMGDLGSGRSEGGSKEGIAER